VIRGIEMSVKSIVYELKNISVSLRSDQDILDIATVSAGNNKKIGKIILDAFSKVGREGVITTQESRTTEDELVVVEGMQFDRGFYSPYFVTDSERMVAEYDNCRLLLFDTKITNSREIVHHLEASMKAEYPLLILAEDFDHEVLATLVVNQLRTSLKVVAVKAPGFGHRKTQYLEDIAILTGGTLVKEDLGMSLDKLDASVLGVANRVTVSKDTCTIVGNGLQLSAVKARVRQIRRMLESADAAFEREKLTERIARLTSGIAVISVGAKTETELREKKLRMEDAICATRATIEEGIVPGGGCTLINLLNKLDHNSLVLENEEQNLGREIVKKALEYPLRIIAANAGVNGAVVQLKISDKLYGNGLGYNAATDTYEDLMTTGVIDPTKVIRCAIENASSVARTFMLADAIVIETQRKHNSSSTDTFYPSDSIY